MGLDELDFAVISLHPAGDVEFGSLGEDFVVIRAKMKKDEFYLLGYIVGIGAPFNEARKLRFGPHRHFKEHFALVYALFDAIIVVAMRHAKCEIQRISDPRFA